MSTEHMLYLPKAVFGLKIAQAIIAVLVLAFAAFNVSIIAFNGSCFAIFTCLYTILACAYYAAATQSSPKIYNWILLLVLEVAGVIFWLSTWAAQATIYAAVLYYDYAYGFDVEYYGWNPNEGAGAAYRPVLITSTLVSVVGFILFCVTLSFVARAVHRHRKAKRPMTYSANNSSFQEPPKEFA